MKDLSTISSDLFNKIRSRFTDVKIGNAAGELTTEESEARFFDINYNVSGKDLGRINIKIDEKALTVIYNESMLDEVTDKSKWYDFLKELRQFARSNLLNFDTRDITKSNLDKRDYQYLAKDTGDLNMKESRLFGTSKTSFQDVGEAKLIVKHSAPVNMENPAGRTQRIESIYIESANGERFRYPHRHLNGARAMARHVANGGTAYDTIGQYISGLSEEIGKLRQFKNYTQRAGVMAEALGDITEQVAERIDSIKLEIAALQKQQYYNAFKENFQPRETEEVPEDLMNDWVDALTIKSFNEELKSVFPYIYSLVKEKTEQGLNYDDLVQEATCPECHCDPCECDEKNEGFDMFSEFENTVDELATPEFEQQVEEEPNEGNEFAMKVQQLKAKGAKPGTKFTTSDGEEHTLEDVINAAGMAVTDFWTQEELQIEAGIDPNRHPQTRDYGRGEDDEEEDDLPFTPDPANKPPSAVAGKHGIGYSTAKHLAKQGMKQAIPKEVVEFIASMYDRDTGTFPKGEEGVKIAVEKKFGEQAGKFANYVVEKLSAKSQTQGGNIMQDDSELSRVRELAGLRTTITQGQISNEDKIDWNGDDVKEIEAMYQKFYVKDTPEGKLLLGDDVGGYFYTDHNGGEREGHITFVYNMDTGKFLEYPEDYNDSYGYLSDREVREFVKDVVREVESKMGEVVAQEAGIDPNQHPQTKDYGPGPSPELEDEVAKLLKRFDDDAMEVGAYGNPNFKKVVAMIAKGDPGAALEEVSYSYADQDGGEVYKLDPYLDDLDDEFRALADMFGESVNTESGVSESVEIDRIQRLAGL